MKAFVHMSLAYSNANIPDGHVQERVYPMEIGDPEELLREIVSLELQEHLILKRADYNRIEELQGGKKQWPIAIVRATQVGAAACEPYAGWADGVTGASGSIFLMSHGVQVLPPQSADIAIDIVPVDYLARIILSCVVSLKEPGTKFLLPYNEVLTEDTKKLYSSSCCFPFIYQMSASGLNPPTWREAYAALQFYWEKTHHSERLSADDYFSSNKTLFKPKFLTKYQIPHSLASITASIGTNSPSSVPTSKLVGLAWRGVEAIQVFLQRRWLFDQQNVEQLQLMLQNDDAFHIKNTFENLEWFNYMVSYGFGIHTLFTQTPDGLRNIAVPSQWDCAIRSKYPRFRNTIIDRKINSIVFSPTDIQERTSRMLSQFTDALDNPGENCLSKEGREEWINDIDASLDDWENEDSGILNDTRRVAAYLGRWPMYIGEDDEFVKVMVLNDKEVGKRVNQVSLASGVSQAAAVNEASKVLQRICVRTQMAYVWFAGFFLDSLFRRIFSSIRIRHDDLHRLQDQIHGKSVVYVPTSKTILDPLLTWYICLRYNLPVPVIACDEALGSLGPISDIFRASGAYFVTRDTSIRTPLTTAVMTAYTKLLLHKHGALLMTIEKKRSRTGRAQKPYCDGMISMILEAMKDRNQNASGDNIFSSLYTLQKDTVFVPIHITYEKIPELQSLVDQALDQSSHLNSRLSDDNALKSTTNDNERFDKQYKVKYESGMYGRVYIGIGDVIDANTDQTCSSSYSEQEFQIAKAIQINQFKAVIVSPVTLVAAAVLFGRMIQGVTIGQVIKYVGWLRDDLLDKCVPLDWQDNEDTSIIVTYGLHLLDSQKHIIMEPDFSQESTSVCVREHVDNIMSLSYMANQLTQIFLPDSLFSVISLSAGIKNTTRDELLDRFRFLIWLFREEFTYSWDVEESFDRLLQRFVTKGIFVPVAENAYERSIIPHTANDDTYTHLSLHASFIYPVLDTYWITSCSLSALHELPYLPRNIIPVLSQWIAAHLISGRRTLFREVLSIETSRNAVNNLLALKYIEAVDPQTMLSPDAQRLLLELGIATNEELVVVARHNEKTASTFSQVMDVESLCHKMERYRYGADTQSEVGFHDVEVFDKCQNQIRAILRTETNNPSTYCKYLNFEESQIIQLVYALRSGNTMMSNDTCEKRNHSRRISEAYNLVKL
ncbi:cyclin-dependent kinase inhibitor far1 [Apophysomyces sp. BC1015]|nr:cyclin-dependent kinase inhibitor far1 [Apophysomyces sp. BC1015]